MILSPERRRHRRRSRSFFPPLGLFAILLLVLFVGEALIMLALPYLLPGQLESFYPFVDPVLLVLLSAPVIWILIIQPLRNEIAKEKIWAELLLEHVVDGVVITDGQGMVRSFNPAASELFGYEQDEVAGTHVCRLFGDRPECRAKVDELCASAGEVTKVYREDTGWRKDGSSFPMDISMSRVRLGGEVAFIAIIRDITKRKKVEAQLIAGERNASVSVVASSIGHELNNAATALMGFAELLARKPEDAALSTHVAAVFTEQTHTLASHAANLLEIGKPREPVFKPLKLADFLAELTAMLKVSGVLKRYEVVEEHDPGQPLVSGDRGLLEQVFRNLEINAAQAMGSRGILTVRSQAREGFVVVTVEDNGVGIPPEFMPNVFEPFRTTKSERGGTGLGMYIAKKVVEQHGGTIAVESMVGVGTKVTVRLPVMD